MSSTYSFREANIEDFELILKWTEALMDHEALDEKIELPLANNISEQVGEWIKNLIADDNTLIIIATHIAKKTPHGLIIGYMQLQPNKFTIYDMHGVIQMVWVEKSQRNKGLALQLVQHMEDTFKNLNIPYCEIQHSASNHHAESFWNKAGYQIVSQSCRKMLN